MSFLNWIPRRLAAAITAAAIAGTAPAATIAPAIQERLTKATFEVVVAKPAEGSLTYEKPLPLELLSFRERTDKFRSIGTAWAIGPNRFVSAGHVIASAAGSQFGSPELRDSNGKTYAIDRIIKYSSAEDYVVFAVRDAPSPMPLTTSGRPPLGSQVFAVGNAFGEGVVIREGLYTSDTPEELEGRWKWLRFSAAVSPGNSGGPLVDKNGSVIAVVVRKSPNENLNFAVAVDQVLQGSEQWAVLQGRSAYRSPVMRATDVVELNEKLALPRAVADFSAALLSTLAASAAANQAQFLLRHGAQMFPRGDNSVQLLNSLYVAHFPRLIAENEAGLWSVAEPQTKRLQLDRNGYVDVGSGMSDGLERLRLPDGVALASVFKDSKLFMDLLLRANPLYRSVGSDSVRVTSLGNALEEHWYTDDFGRVWQMRTWPIPFDDSVLVTYALPTPSGCVLLIARSASGSQQLLRENLRQLARFVYVSLPGTLQQWLDYLVQPSLQPETMRKLNIRFEFDKEFAVQTERFALIVPAALQKLAPSTMLILKFGFLQGSAAVVWDVAGVYLADGEQASRWIDVLRRPRPPATLPSEFASRWRAMTTGAAPYDSIAYSVAGARRIEAVANAKEIESGKSNVAYTLTVTAGGEQSQTTMSQGLDQLRHGLTVLEH